MKKEKELQPIVKGLGKLEIMDNHNFIVYQQIVLKKEITEDGTKLSYYTIVRRVRANNEYEALGKFIVKTSYEYTDAIERFLPRCCELFELETIE